MFRVVTVVDDDYRQPVSWVIGFQRRSDRLTHDLDGLIPHCQQHRDRWPICAMRVIGNGCWPVEDQPHPRDDEVQHVGDQDRGDQHGEALEERPCGVNETHGHEGADK